MRGSWRLLGTALLLAALTAGSALPAAAKSPSVSHGTWAYVVNGSCDGQIGSVMGKWNVTLHEDGTATVSMVAFTGLGQHHASWGGNYFKSDWIQVPVSGPGFDLVASDVFGFVTLSFVLDEHGVLTFTIDPYCMDGSAASMVGSAS